MPGGGPYTANRGGGAAELSTPMRRPRPDASHCCIASMDWSWSSSRASNSARSRLNLSATACLARPSDSAPPPPGSAHAWPRAGVSSRDSSCSNRWFNHRRCRRSSASAEACTPMAWAGLRRIDGRGAACGVLRPVPAAETGAGAALSVSGVPPEWSAGMPIPGAGWPDSHSRSGDGSSSACSGGDGGRAAPWSMPASSLATVTRSAGRDCRSKVCGGRGGRRYRGGGIDGGRRPSGASVVVSSSESAAVPMDASPDTSMDASPDGSGAACPSPLCRLAPNAGACVAWGAGSTWASGRSLTGAERLLTTDEGGRGAAAKATGAAAGAAAAARNTGGTPAMLASTRAASGDAD
eukprot:scaffold34878_cov101-Isochrysis_galbana.AAC.7